MTAPTLNRGVSEPLRVLSPEEARAIRSLKQLAKTWPPSLWLFSANGALCVMRCDEDGRRAQLPDNGADPAFVITTIGIPNDGGDW